MFQSKDENINIQVWILENVFCVEVNLLTSYGNG